MEEYTDFRHYVISNFPTLESLDGTAVTPEEREAAARVYVRVRQSAASGSRRASVVEK